MVLRLTDSSLPPTHSLPICRTHATRMAGCVVRSPTPGRRPAPMRNAKQPPPLRSLIFFNAAQSRRTHFLFRLLHVQFQRQTALCSRFCFIPQVRERLFTSNCHRPRCALCDMSDKIVLSKCGTVCRQRYVHRNYIHHARLHFYLWHILKEKASWEVYCFPLADHSKRLTFSEQCYKKNRHDNLGFTLVYTVTYTKLCDFEVYFLFIQKYWFNASSKQGSKNKNEFICPTLF